MILGELHGIRTARITNFEVLASPPSPGSAALGCRLLQPLLKDAIWDRSPGGSLCRQIIGYCIFRLKDMVQVQDLKVPFQLLGMEQIGGQLWVIAAAFTLHLLDDELRIAFHEQLSDPKRQGSAQPKNEGLILLHVVGCLEVEVHHILELLPVMSEE
jgi:hypothetical protein